MIGGLKHSNTVENFFSIFKRGVIGTYHHMSEAHLGPLLRKIRFPPQHAQGNRWRARGAGAQGR